MNCGSEATLNTTSMLCQCKDENEIYNSTDNSCYCPGFINSNNSCELCGLNASYNGSACDCDTWNEVYNTSTNTCSCPGYLDIVGNCILCGSSATLSENRTDCVCDDPNEKF